MSTEILEDFAQWPEAPPKPPAQRSYFREVTWTWRDVAIGLAPLVIARVLPQIVGPGTFQEIARRIWLAAGLLGWAWMFGYPLVVARKRQGAWPRLPRFRRIALEALCGFISVPLLMFTLGLIMFTIILIFRPTTLPSSPFEPVFRSPDRFSRLAMMIVGITVAPLAEEVFFRGLLYSALRQRLPIAVAAVVQAIVFGLAHPFSLPQAAAVAFVGLGLALVYEWRKTLVAPVFMHAFQNSLGFAILTLTVANSPMLGVASEPRDGGCALVEVVPGSAADNAGLRVGDVITEINGRMVSDHEQLSSAIRLMKIGDQVPVEYLRDGKAERVDVILKGPPR